MHHSPISTQTPEFPVVEFHQRCQTQPLRHALIVQSEIRRAMGDFLRSQGFVEISPVVITPETDPLCHDTVQTEITYYGHRYRLTQSMILHKQIALLSHPKIFIFSPNVRLEPLERARTGRHLIEFTQLDLEVAGASRDEIIALGEQLLIHTLKHLKEKCREQQAFFQREIKIPSVPFPRVTYREAQEQFGPDFEIALSQAQQHPFWLIDIPLEHREFYDREDPDRPGILLDMDLVYPEGYGEALSGGEREFQPERIRTRIQQQGLRPEDFSLYLALAEQGLPRSAGFGIGLERLTRFVCGLPSVADTILFPKMPGELGL